MFNLIYTVSVQYLIKNNVYKENTDILITYHKYSFVLDKHIVHTLDKRLHSIADFQQRLSLQNV